MPVAQDVASGGPYVLPTDSVLGQSPQDTVGFYGGNPVPQILQGLLAGANGLLTVYATSQSPASVAPNTTTEYEMTVSGVGATDMVVAAIKPTTQAGLAVGTSRTISGHVYVSFGNLTGTTITPTTTETYIIVTASAALQFPAVTLSPASVAASTTAEQTFTVSGVEPGMAMAVTKPTLQAGLLVTGCRAPAENTVAVTFMNVTGSAITPTASESYLFFGARGLRLQPVMQRFHVQLTPVSVAANTTAEQTFTVSGLIASTSVVVHEPYVVSGVALVGARVSAANTLALNFANTTGSALYPPAGDYNVGFFPNVVPASGSSNVQLATQGIDAGLARLVSGQDGVQMAAQSQPTNPNVLTG
jgi:hypothetical protein